jgi:hypothetical protein
MDLVVMEICLGMMASTQTHKHTAEQHCTGWDTWFCKFLASQFNNAGLETGVMWAFAVAQALKIVSQDVVGVSTARLHPSLIDTTAAASAFHALVDFICETAASWSGSSLLEARTSVLLHHSMDSLLQAQLQQPRPALADALARMLHHSMDIANTMNTQGLHKLRTVTSKLTRMAMAVLRSPIAVLPAHEIQEAPSANAKPPLAVRVPATYVSACKAAEVALAATAADVVAGSGAGAAEAPIGWQTALVQQLDRSPEMGSFCRDVALAGLPWALAAQALDHPDLQSVLPEVRRLIRLKACPLDEVAPRRDVLAAALGAEAWQVRQTALYMLQAFWFRNYFALSDSDMLALVRLGKARLQDPRMEIRGDASRFLSGLLKCVPAAGVAEFRAEVLSRAARLFPRRPKRCRNGALQNAWHDDHHACVLELQALVASSPYEIKEWMYEVLLALTVAARAPEPIKQAATEALGAFRQSHKDMSPLPLKERLPETVWDSIQGVASSSSYFV